MQPLVTEQAYRFIPPYRGTFWIRLVLPFVPGYLRRNFGIESIEYQGVEHLRQSLRAGHGIVVAPNHPRPADPIIMGALGLEAGRPCYLMASWHVFTEVGRWRAWLARRMGAFSVHRWSLDREAIKSATHILATAERPLVVFPEGHITRTNDRLAPLLEGTAFLARTGAKQRAKATPGGKVVLHPVALKYFFDGDLEKSAGGVLSEIEQRLTWPPQHGRPLVDRVTKVGKALLSLKEIEYLGEPQQGDIHVRIERLIDHLLLPLEKEWLASRRADAVAERAKRLRTVILPDLVEGKVDDKERSRRWKQLADIYVAQQLACYPPDYVNSSPTPERILETVERFEEDITDVARVHRPFRLVVRVGEAIPVNPERDRSAAEDPLMAELERRLNEMLVDLTATQRAKPAAAPALAGPALEASRGN
ncbi:MAG: 1-acyl-sn-glycerol-3-phosphate acyltransferase [Planctomycetia bacterium]|nr:1-acyl-sn-glycerol-3-phosphate acyltransferase [Planctomycetia bacterium]